MEEGRSLQMSGQYGAAEQKFNEVLTLRRNVNDEDPSCGDESYLDLISLYLETGRLRQASILIGREYRILRSCAQEDQSCQRLKLKLACLAKLIGHNYLANDLLRSSYSNLKLRPSTINAFPILNFLNDSVEPNNDDIIKRARLTHIIIPILDVFWDSFGNTDIWSFSDSSYACAFPEIATPARTIPAIIKQFYEKISDPLLFGISLERKTELLTTAIKQAGHMPFSIDLIELSQSWAKFQHSMGNLQEAAQTHEYLIIYMERMREFLLRKDLCAACTEALRIISYLYGISAGSLAEIYDQTSNLKKAENYYRKAISSFMVKNETTILTDALRYSKICLDCMVGKLATVLAKKGEIESARKLWQDALSMREEQIRVVSIVRSEDALHERIEDALGMVASLFSLIDTGSADPKMVSVAMAAGLLYKGRFTDEITFKNDHIEAAMDLGLVLLRRVRELRMKIAALELGGHVDAAYKGSSDRLGALKVREQTAEAELGHWLTSTKSELPWEDEIVRQVARRIPAGAVLIDFISYEPAAGLGKGQRKQDRRLLAFVLRPSAQVSVVPLGSARPIEQSAMHLHQKLSQQEDALAVSAAARVLHRQVFAPLTGALGDARHLLIVPDGQLHLVPFGVLEDDEARLEDRFRISYLSSGRDLLREPTRQPASGVVVFADPDFDASSSRQQGLASHHAARDTEGSAQELQRAVSTFRTRDLASLPGARGEAADILSAYPDAKLFLGADAREGTLFALPPPGVLHIATHGFFLDDPDTDAESSRLPLVKVDSRPPRNPLLRSVLVLAGAARPPSSDLLEDGWTSALEVSSLWLKGTQMVVLSACNTARGAVTPGQGVAGLRRAFLVAGAETVVASLWPVSDTVTRELMRAFYRRLKEGEDRAVAMHHAAQEIRASHPHPYFWASFLVVGQDGPLR